MQKSNSQFSTINSPLNKTGRGKEAQKPIGDTIDMRQ